MFISFVALDYLFEGHFAQKLFGFFGLFELWIFVEDCDKCFEAFFQLSLFHQAFAKPDAKLEKVEVVY